MHCYLTTLSIFPVMEFPELLLELHIIDNTPVTMVPIFHPIRGTGYNGVACPHDGMIGWTCVPGL